jgi:hypothetical protein
LTRREERRSSRGQLERKGQVVETHAELTHGPVRLEGRIEGSGTRNEKVDGILVDEGRHRIDLFP